MCRQLWTTALSFHLARCWCVSRIQGPRRCPVNRAQRPGNPPLDVSFPELGRRCDIIGRSHKARHLSTSTWCIHPTGPGSCLHLTRGSKSLLTAALATTVNVERRNNAITQTRCTIGVSGAGGWYHPILIPEIQGHISIVCKAKHAQALFGKREKKRLPLHSFFQNMRGV